MFLDDGLGATPEKRTPSFSWIAAISIIVGFVYPFVAVLVAPDRCEATCEVALACSG